MRKVLLVNPWIYDFAAYDYGIKPVGLLYIAEFLRRHGDEVHFIDCLDGSAKHKDEYGFSKFQKKKIDKPESIKEIERPYFRYGISTNDFLAKLEKLKDIDFSSIYVTSGMTYWYPGVMTVTQHLKKFFPSSPIILGGIYATLLPTHAEKFSGADSLWKGDYIPRDVYMEKDFYPAYDLLENKEILPIQLTYGCPYRCTYCASKILKSSFCIKDPVNLFEEVMFYKTKFGTEKFVFYDDALTFRSDVGIKKFLRMVVASGQEFSFHTPNGLHAKYIDDELAYLFKKTNFEDLRISLETSDESLQAFTGGKVTNSDLRLALRNLKEAGFTKNDLGIYLLIGSPWLDVDKTIKDIMFINSLGAKAVLASYSPIPGTSDYSALLKSGIIPRYMDPLWHNKTIFSELLAPKYMQKIREIRQLTSKLNKL